MDDRSNPPGFAGSTRPVPPSPQDAQRTTQVNQLVRPDQSAAPVGTGGMNTTPGPRG